jgi:phospholipid transport system substrate-binding protein
MIETFLEIPMRKRDYCTTVFIPLLLLWLVAPVMAGEPTEKIKQTTDTILALLSDPELSAPDKVGERRRLIRKAVDERFDWEEISMRALGRPWLKLTDEEKSEFTKLFGRLVERNYMNKVEGYSGEKVHYIGESVKGKYGEVNVKVHTNANQEITVDYRLIEKRGNWMVYDVLVEGISLVKNYRVQFNDILKKSSFQALMTKLREKVNQE